MTERQFSQLLKGNMKRYEKPSRVLCKALGVSDRQTQRYVDAPGNVKINDFLILIAELHVRDEDLISYLGEKNR